MHFFRDPLGFLFSLWGGALGGSVKDTGHYGGDRRCLEEQANQSAVAVQKIAAVSEDLKNLGDKISGVGTTLTKTVTTPIVGLGTVAVKTAADSIYS